MSRSEQAWQESKSDITDAILARRSVREGFDGSSIAEDILAEIVECGLAAPSSKNAQPWRMHVVTNRDLLAKFADAVEEADGVDDYVPHDPRSGRPRPEYISTVLESAQVLRDVSATIFIENRGFFSGGRDSLARADRTALAGSLVGFSLEMIGVGAAVENMWLAAESFGLRVAFMGDVLIAETVIADRLCIEGDLAGVLALGRSRESAPRRHQLLAVDVGEHVRWHRPV